MAILHLTNSQKWVRGLLRICSWLVPQELRRDWFEDWNSEFKIWLPAEAQLRTGSTLRRLAGALSHATWLRANPWRPRIVIQDFLFGVRQLTRQLGFTLTAVAVLALGIGSTTTIFTFLNGLLLRPLQIVSEPERLITLWRTQNDSGADTVSYPVYEHYRDHNQVLQGLAAFTNRSFPVIRDDSLLLLSGDLVTPNYLEVLKVDALIGARFSPDQRDELVVLISHRLWEDSFGSSGAVFGQTLSIRGHSLLIQGVMLAGFKGTNRLSDPDLWIPVGAEDLLAPSRWGNRMQQPGLSWLNMIGRLRPGIAAAQAQESLEVLANNLRQIYPQNGDAGIVVYSATGLSPEARQQVNLVAALLMGLVGLLLLISCANVSGLILARNSLRQQELGVRQTLGAGRLRILRQLLAESLILGLLAAAASVALAFWSGGLLVDLFARIYGVPFALDPTPDLTVLTFSMALGLGCVLIIGLGPALGASRSDLIDALRPGGGRLTAGRRRRSWLVTAQVAVCTLVLTAGGLFVRTLNQMQSVDPGFRSDGVRVYSLFPQFLGLSQERGRDFYQQLQDELAGFGDIESLTLSTSAPLVGGHSSAGFQTQDLAHVGRPFLIAERNVIAPGFFSTLSIPLLQGRDFSASLDASGQISSAIVSRSLAGTLWPGEDPLGKVFDAGGESSLQVVGVASDIKYRDVRESRRLAFYRPLSQDYRGNLILQLKSAGNSTESDARVREIVTRLLPQHPISGQPLSDRIANTFGEQRLLARMTGLFSLAALLLTSVGLYGIVAFSVSQQQKEIGIRSALGASRAQVVRQVLRAGLRVSVRGLVLGVGLLAALSRFLSLEGTLFGVSPFDPVSVLVSLAILLAVTLLASLLPARRAASVAPLEALRCD